MALAREPGKETGSESAQRHSDVQHNLWKIFGEFCEVFGGEHCGRSAIALNDRSAVEPDHYYYQAALDDCTIEGNYFQGVPNLIAEVLSPATRELDRGPRMEIYRQAGVPHIWLLDPETETVELYALGGHIFNKTGRHGPGESFRSALFPEVSIAVASLFDTQEKRHRDRWTSKPDEPDPIPTWLVPRDQMVGLEVMFFLGHPEKRYEIWNNRAPCLLAFGSPEEAAFRFGHFLEEDSPVGSKRPWPRQVRSSQALSLPKSAAFNSRACEGTSNSTSPSMHSSIASSVHNLRARRSVGLGWRLTTSAGRGRSPIPNFKMPMLTAIST